MKLPTCRLPAAMLAAVVPGAVAGGACDQVADSILSGPVANPLSGTHVIRAGVLALAKPVGVTAIAGDMVLGGGMAARFLSDPRPPGAPGNVTATVGVSPDALDVLWSESDNHPAVYQVLRATGDDPAASEALSGMIPAGFVAQFELEI